MNTAKTLTAKDIEELKNRPIDFSDIPELTDSQVKELYPKNWRPRKKAVSARIDLDTIEWLKSPEEKGYLQRMNAVLRWAKMKGCPIMQLQKPRIRQGTVSTGGIIVTTEDIAKANNNENGSSMIGEPLHHSYEFVEQKIRVVRATTSFRMKLHAERRNVCVFDALNSSVVDIYKTQACSRHQAF